MLLKTLLLTLLPAAYARITINIAAGADDRVADVSFHGSTVDVIPEVERTEWHITDALLKSAAGALSGRQPDNVYVKSPTPWNDLYTTYGWQQVQRTLVPIAARVLDIRSQPVYLFDQEHINQYSAPSNHTIFMQKELQQTVSTTWSKTRQLEVGQEIEYNVNFIVGGANGSSSVSFAAGWGKSVTQTSSVTVGSSTLINIDLAPGQAVIATLYATQGTIDVQVDYRATLRGVAACNYSRRYNGHHFWAYDINACLRAANYPTTIDSSEVISIGFHAHGRIVVVDKKTNKKVVETAAPIVNGVNETTDKSKK